MGEKINISFLDFLGTEIEIEDEYAREMLADESAARAEDVAVLEARMDTFTALPAGSTAGDAELMDARIGYNGTVYPNVGDAVRAQAVRTEVPYKTRPGYLSSNGGYSNPGAETQEVYTNKLPCFPGDTFTMSFTWESTMSKWITVVWYDENGKFMSRSNAYYSGSGTSYTRTATIPANAYYYAVTWRTYGNCIANFFYNGSVYDIRNRVDKGLSRGELNGGFDTAFISTTSSSTFEGDVQEAGNSPITDFIPVTNTANTNGVVTTVDDAFTNSYIVLFFDHNKNYIGNTGWRTTKRYSVTLPTGCGYVRFAFNENATIENIKQYFRYTFSLTQYDEIAWAFNENVKGVNHRGYSTAPENTLPAYKLSKQMGFKYCECDVSMTSDRVPVLLHDNTINRTARNADGTEISENINIGSITYEQALTYDFGIYKGSQYAGTKIPTFAQFIALCRNLGLRPYIELKSGGGYTEAEIHGLVDAVESLGMKGKVTWISFYSPFLEYIKNYDLAARIGYVVNDIDSTVITTAQGLKTTTNEVFIDSSWTVTDAKIELCTAAGLPLEVWTVDNTANITRLNPYISGVTSNNLIAAKVLYEANID